MNLLPNKLTIGIVPGIADLYNRLWPDVQHTLNKFIEETASQLRNNSLEVLTAKPVSTIQKTKDACKKMETENVDLVIIALAPYCPSGILVPAIEKLKTPVLLWPIQSMFEITADNYDLNAILLNHGVHAVQDLATVLRKRGNKFGVIHGHLKQKDFIEELNSWVQAARALRAMRYSNPIQIGGHFADMLDLQIGNEQFVKQIFLKPRIVPAAKFVTILNSIDSKQIKKCIGKYKEVFEIANDVDDKLLTKTAKGEAALRQIMAVENSYACGLNFLNLCNDKRIADALHVAACMLMYEGLGYAGEGDWVTAAFIRGMQQGFGMASFSEMFSVCYAHNRLVLKHWGEGNFAMSRERPKLCASSLKDANPANFAVVDFEFSTGPASLINLNSTPDSNGQLISVAGTITEDHLPKASGPRAVFKPQAADVRELLTAYACNGGSHHLALVKGDASKMLHKLSRLTGWDYIQL